MIKGVRRLVVITCMVVIAFVCLMSGPARVPVASVAATSQSTYQLVHGFENPPRGPVTLVRGSDGALYGATTSGQPGSDDQAQGAATLFKINEDGSGFRKLHDDNEFKNGVQLVKGPGALLYGMTYISLFRIYEDGSGFQTIHEFGADGGTSPNKGSLIMGLDGVLYGTTGNMVFKIQGDGSGFQTLHIFDCPENGERPNVVVQAPDGTLYGTTESGGTRFRGTLFKISANGGVFQKLLDLDGLDAESPTSLIMGSDGALYGTSRFAGTSGQGTVFKITVQQARVSVTVVREFDDAESSYPNGIVEDGNGKFFGTGAGFVFTMNVDGSGFQTFHEFRGAGDPENLVTAPGGMLFGTTFTGGTPADGSRGEGTVFGIRADGSGFRHLHVFGWGYGAFPEAGLIEGGDGVLYGTTRGTPAAEGDGTIFAINLDGSGLRTLHDFDSVNGSKPRVSLVKGSDGALYGATPEQGARGTVFKINKEGTDFRKLLDEGSSALVTGSDGGLYGTIPPGRTLFGTVFRIGTDGTGYQTLHEFDGVDGAWPIASLVKGSDGALYGTTSEGGISGAGTVFKINEDGSGFQKLHDFDFANGASPSAALVRGPGAVLFGTTTAGGASDSVPWGDGTVFRINEDGTGFQKLHDFDGVNGSLPRGLVWGADGALYGTTAFGGAVVGDMATYPTVPQIPGPRRSRIDPACSPATVDRIVIRSEEEGVIESNDCLEESIAYRGYVHMVINRVNNRNDPYEFQHFLQNSIMRFDGVGLASGASYDISGLGNFQTQSENPDGLPTTVTWVLKTTITRRSDGRVWSADTRIKIVFSGNGELRVDRFEISVDCRSRAGSSTQTGGAQTKRQYEAEQPMIEAAATSGNFGTIFRINPNGTGFQKLYDFDLVRGARPSPLILASDGAFYGTAEVGGPGNGGVVFRFMPGL